MSGGESNHELRANLAKIHLKKYCIFKFRDSLVRPHHGIPGVYVGIQAGVTIINDKEMRGVGASENDEIFQIRPKIGLFVPHLFTQM